MRGGWGDSVRRGRAHLQADVDEVGALLQLVRAAKRQDVVHAPALEAVAARQRLGHAPRQVGAQAGGVVVAGGDGAVEPRHQRAHGRVRLLLVVLKPKHLFADVDGSGAQRGGLQQHKGRALDTLRAVQRHLDGRGALLQHDLDVRLAVVGRQALHRHRDLADLAEHQRTKVHHTTPACARARGGLVPVRIALPP